MRQTLRWSLAAALVAGILTTVFTSTWLASRRFAIDLNLSHVDVGNALIGAPAYTLTTGGWLVFPLVFATISLVAFWLLLGFGWAIEKLVRWVSS